MSKLPPLAAVRAFEAAARLQNFSRAGEELGMTQAAISYQIRQLEQRLGRALFVREKGRVRLSETGQRLLPTISGAFAAMGDAFAAISSDDAEVLTISAAITLGGTWLSARIGRFQLRYPDLAVRLLMSNDLVDFDATSVDVALRTGNGHWPGLRTDFLFRSHVTPICSPVFLDANHIATPADLLRAERLAPNDPWWAGWLAQAGIGTPPPPRRGIELDSQLQEAIAVQGGFGIALMTPLYWRTELETGRLVRPFETIYEPGTGNFLVHRDNRVGVRKIERFREWLHEELEMDRQMIPEPLWEPLP
ncbi:MULTISPECIES: LysR substrate-binding domain-containing protein [unclassified Sphingopyxis]|uniref:LysR substrate-binding domain-containing protein n=1 Tax=unclassified Sphingopyxis TaxID=2614943 RepID=UPI00072FAC29|nr:MULTISPECIES: LysR substrate-binding domain-containing protein [unclassified Sphingopyxis]KTE25887.1 LysR family transcriptional regulator [Sphingopyxis sp. H057]KTE51567.1 LysR family transcriptional regulator [Sphingopyxis sp. H073]KTE53930.1 LysR family transcriptional regulator [Sphingopyxis sp. H071]KTE58933.1 LysR family transcriptional regulator [Sphingopyxis sp. H107]KTE65554.1 LysR family transcriptional regulator [Sphingopyxis sp. H100]